MSAGVGGVPECQGCGGHVSDDFARVFGDNADEVYNCLTCSDWATIQRGDAARGGRA